MSSTKKAGVAFPITLLIGSLVLLYLRLNPFVFSWTGRIPVERIDWRPLSLVDIPINILVILPFGFGLAGTLARAGWSRPAVACGTLIFGVLISIVLESMQLFMLNRAPSLADVAANALGLALGYALFRAWEDGWARTIDRTVTTANLLAIVAFYALFAALLTNYFYRAAELRNWAADYPLNIGSEADGSRTWSGKILDLFFLDREMDEGEAAAALAGDLPADLLARYDLTGRAPFVDEAGVLPPLAWGAGPISAQTGTGVIVGAGEWLATGRPVAAFSLSGRAANAFTIGIRAVPAVPRQAGPARIASISSDVNYRNIMAGQHRDRLVIRLRTPMTGDNGQRPQFIVPDVFTESGPRTIIVTYNHPMLQVYLDQQPEPQALSLAPGFAFFAALAGRTQWFQDLTGHPYRYDLAYLLLLVGLPVLVVGELMGAKYVVRKWGKPGDRQ
jgi:glycopeptide antibiotics resistance protein